MIWRDDDVLSKRSNLDAFRAVDDLLRAFGQRHTVACIASTLTPDLAAELRVRRVDVQLHCWTHVDLTAAESVATDLARGVEAIERLVGTRPRTLYPPWNRRSLALERAATALGLTVSTDKVSLDQYIRVAGAVSERVINFHHWESTDRERLREALEVNAAWQRSHQKTSH